MKKTFLLIVMLLGITSFCAAQNLIDVLYLKDGSVIKGQIIEQIPDQSLKIQMYDGSILVYPMDTVEKIVKQSSSLDYRRSVNSGATKGCKDTWSKRSLRGYKGFVDMAYLFGDDDRFETNMSHGFQINNYFFVGGGMGFHSYRYDGDVFSVIPFFGNFRVNFLNKKVTPFGDVKLGYSCGSFFGAYTSMDLGVRVSFTRKLALNFSCTFSAQDYDAGDFHYRNHDGYYDDGRETTCAAGVKIGFEF